MRLFSRLGNDLTDRFSLIVPPAVLSRILYRSSLWLDGLSH